MRYVVHMPWRLNAHALNCRDVVPGAWPYLNCRRDVPTSTLPTRVIPSLFKANLLLQRGMECCSFSVETGKPRA